MKDSTNDMKALFIVVNAGFADEVINIAREAGAGGATILNARGEGVIHKSFLGITVESEKEMILSIVDSKTAKGIMTLIKERAGLKSPANSICFTMPVEKTTQITKNMIDNKNQ